MALIQRLKCHEIAFKQFFGKLIVTENASLLLLLNREVSSVIILEVYIFWMIMIVLHSAFIRLCRY